MDSLHTDVRVLRRIPSNVLKLMFSIFSLRFASQCIDIVLRNQLLFFSDSERAKGKKKKKKNMQDRMRVKILHVVIYFAWVANVAAFILKHLAPLLFNIK